MVKKTNKYIFILKNIDSDKIDKKYDIKKTNIPNIPNKIKTDINIKKNVFDSFVPIKT